MAQIYMLLGRDHSQVCNNETVSNLNLLVAQIYMSLERNQSQVHGNNGGIRL